LTAWLTFQLANCCIAKWQVHLKRLEAKSTALVAATPFLCQITDGTDESDMDSEQACLSIRVQDKAFLPPFTKKAHVDSNTRSMFCLYTQVLKQRNIERRMSTNPGWPTVRFPGRMRVACHGDAQVRGNSTIVYWQKLAKYSSLLEGPSQAWKHVTVVMFLKQVLYRGDC